MKDAFTKQWITENALEIIAEYGKGVLTIRGLHYRLVARGMTNSQNHYKRVVSAMIDARWENSVDWEAFSDRDREMVGTTDYEVTDLNESIESGKRNIQAWMRFYRRNKWERQPYYVEVMIEKKALQGVFETVCRWEDVTLGACKGYPSLTFLHDAYKRMQQAHEAGHKPLILYFGDYDPSGEDIPRAIKENIERMGAEEGLEIELRRIALTEQQVVEWKLPPAPVKEGDTRSAAWDGLGQVELDAVDPKQLRKMCEDAIRECFDKDIYEDVKAQEADEREEYRRQLREFVNNMPDEE